MTTLELVQVPFVISHRSTALVPAGTPETVLVGEDGVVIVAVPLTTDHNPVPTVGVLPARVNVELLHCVIFEPALATVGASVLVNTTSSVTEGHTPFDIVHLSVALLPAARPVTVVVADDGVVTDTAPLTMLQLPVPVVAAVAPIVKLPLLHCVMSVPATVPVGAGVA